MDLLERDAPLATLEALLSGAAGGAGHVALVAGEAGIGKTSLLSALRERRGSARLWWGACDALQTPHPLAPLHDIARDAQPGFAALLRSDAARAALFDAVLAELQSGPTLLVFEDVHWADEATLDLLKFLGRRIAGLPCLLVATYRNDEIGARHPLRRVASELPSAHVTRLGLACLSADAVGRMARRALRSPAGIHETTRGNPFFVVELLQHGMARTPQGVQDLVLARYATLGPDAQAVVALVSLVPRQAERWLVDAIAGPSLDAVDSCLDCGLLVADGDTLSFRHELARAAVEESLSPLRARGLHARILAALEGRHAAGGTTPLARLVHHAARASNGEAALRFAPEAAREARMRGAHREAAAHFDTALAHAAEQPDDLRAGLLEALSYELYLTDRLEGALAARAQARELWRRNGDALKEGDTVRWMSRLAWYNGRTAEAEEYADAAIAILSALTPGPELAMACSNRAQLHMLGGRPAPAIALGGQALALARASGDRETEAHALNNIGSARLVQGDAGGREDLEASLALSLAGGFEEHAARAHTNLAYEAVIGKRYPEAKHELQRGIAYCDARDLDAWARYMAAHEAQVLMETGDWDGAVALATRLVQWPGLAAISRIPALTVLGRIGVRRGESGAGERLAEALPLALPTRSALRIGPVVAASMEAARLRGDAAASRALARHMDGLDEHSRYGDWIHAEIACEQRCAGLDVAMPAHCPAPYAFEFAGDWRAAADVWRALGCPFEEARSLSNGDADACREALAGYETLGATAVAAALRDRLRREGVKGIPRGRRDSTQANPHGLTDRELEILHLLCAGLKNAEVAARLHRSVRTVDHHVAAILAKLGARTRSEAVAAALALAADAPPAN